LRWVYWLYYVTQANCPGFALGLIAGRLYRSFMRCFFLTRVIASPNDEIGSEEDNEESEDIEDAMEVRVGTCCIS